MDYKTASLKEIPALDDRELQERMCELLEKQETHLKYFSTVLTAYIILTFIGICAVVVPMFVK